ncbi:MAG: phosphotransferase family protein [Myxococcales bacterium]|nr:phosphotransferase family protein [Myxococcales bacterium]
MSVVSEDRARIESAIRRRYGEAARVEDLRLATLGQSNRTWLLDIVESGGARREAVLRQETYQGPGNPFLPSHKQYRAICIARELGVPTPEPFFLFEEADGLGQGFAMARVEGETLPKKILEDPAFASVRPRLAYQCGEIFASLHRCSEEALAFLADSPDSVDPIRAQRDRIDAYREAHPALELGLRWLELNRPREVTRTLVHGDMRNGNFIVGEDGIRAVLDWECCHIGDPLEDLGWLCTRSWRFGRYDRPVGGFGKRADLYAGYRSVAGREIDEREARYWEIFGLVRWAAINLMQAFGHVELGRSSVVFAACGRNCAEMEYDLLRTLDGSFD